MKKRTGTNNKILIAIIILLFSILMAIVIAFYKVYMTSSKSSVKQTKNIQQVQNQEVEKQNDVENGKLLLVSEREGLYSCNMKYINSKNGKVVLDLGYNYYDANDFSEGLACVHKEVNRTYDKSVNIYSIQSKSGYIDEKGNIAIQIKFDRAGDFSEGLAAVVVNKKIGYINKKGEFVIEPQFDPLYNPEDVNWRYSAIFSRFKFSQGLAPIRKNKKWGYINQKGEFVIKPQFDCAGTFSEDLAPVMKGEKWGYINKKGEFVIEPQFLDANIFSEGLAFVEARNKELNGRHLWGIIDKNGNFIKEPVYEYGGPFSEGLAAVASSDYTIAYINKEAKVVIPYRFRDAWPFSQGLARISTSNSTANSTAYIDKKGNIVYGNLGKVKKKQSTNKHSKAYMEYNKNHSNTYDDESYVPDYDNMTDEEFKEVYKKEMEHFSDWSNVDK
ncbi:WG repeat-containing protein [Clostridium ganghwense]|uniref:WG repeat-containing protein n=1 Tax=Clostridium ganghwense TaxID=312089 RepID=A0ABT4CRL1_9CLOT|nr:WG repeat-containing protein [Clostridium ganghwense]MCY6371691.1 WG repeat-containing protein [Clostridium ganghwense]